jgi:hypothetical protein
LKKARQILEKESEEDDVEVNDLSVILYGHHTGALAMSLIVYHLSLLQKSEQTTFDRDAFMKLTKQEPKKKKDDDEEYMFDCISKNFTEFAPVISGCILSAPYLKIVFPDWQKKVIRFISKAISTYTISVEIEPEKITSDPAMQKILQRDPLRITDLSVKQLTDWECIADALLTESISNQITLPLLVIQGGQDYVSDAACSKKFFDLIGSTDKHYEFLFGFMHDLHLEKQREKVFSSVIKWMNTRIVIQQSEDQVEFAESKLNEMMNERKGTILVKSKKPVFNEPVDSNFEMNELDKSQICEESTTDQPVTPVTAVELDNEFTS